MRRLGLAAIPLFMAGGGASAAPAPTPPVVVAPPFAGDDIPRVEMIRRTAAWTGLPESRVVAFGDGVAVALTGPEVAGGQTGVAKGVAVQAEAVSDDAAAALGWKSMRASVDVDCAQGRDFVRSMEVFADHDLKGASRTLKVPGAWGRPDPRAFLGGVVEAVCRRSNPVAATPQTRPDASAEPVAPGPSAVEVQVISSTVRADADRWLAKLDLRGLRAFVVAKEVGGRTVYRGMVAGFASVAAARDFCRALSARGRPCLVRPGSS